MASQDHRPDTRSSRVGYSAAIIVSALGHAALFVLIFFVMPRYLSAPPAPPPAYTVKIVDNIPAGDLGTHLPKLSQVKHEEAKPKPREEPQVEAPKPPPAAPEPDKNAIALNSSKPDTPTPTPTPEPTAESTAAPTAAPTVAPTPEPTAAPPSKTPKPHATPRPTPVVKKPKPAPSIVLAKASSTPSVEQRMAKLRERLMAEHLKNEKSRPSEEEEGDEDTDQPAPKHGAKGGGPVVANVATAGTGAGVGPGTGSAGIQQDLDFLLYYQAVQKKIKEAWNFPGGSSDLTTTVDFAINPDGSLAGVRIAKSSNDGAFDDSVIRAIRRAAPFPAPPDKFRDQFAAGIQALFKLGELKS